MPVHHLRMLDRHRASYNKQDTVLAQLLYHLNTAHIMLRCPVLVQRWSTISRSWPSVAPTIVRKTRYATCTLTRLQQLLTGPSCNNVGPTLLVRIINKTLAQHWVNAYNSFHLYINMLFFRLTSRINPSCQTDAVLITANKLKRDDSRAWF